MEFRRRVPYLLLLACMVVEIYSARSLPTDTFPLLMPNVRPEKPETYLCTPIRIESNQDYFIVGFTPNATMKTAHHMLLFGCQEPGSSEEVWNCGEMAVRQPGLKTASPCGKGSQVVYAWAHDAPALELPEGVGFRVGGKSPIQYIVLQVHYATVDRFQDGSTDDSGVFLHYTEEPQPKAAGVLLMGTGGRIPANSIEYMETACKIEENKIIHPFAFRTHTHALGRVVSGYKVVKDRKGKDQWTLIGKKDPQLPQMFYSIANEMTLTKGDVVAARCTMVSDRTWTTKIGLTVDDEMCNYYLMYWIDGADSLKQKTCYSWGPPLFTWSRFRLRNIPNDASALLTNGDEMCNFYLMYWASREADVMDKKYCFTPGPPIYSWERTFNSLPDDASEL